MNTPKDHTRIENEKATVLPASTAPSGPTTAIGGGVAIGGNVDNSTIVTGDILVHEIAQAEDPQATISKLLIKALKARRDLGKLDPKTNFDQDVVDPSDEQRHFNPFRVYAERMYELLQKSGINPALLLRIVQLIERPDYTVGEFVQLLDEIIDTSREEMAHLGD